MTEYQILAVLDFLLWMSCNGAEIPSVIASTTFFSFSAQESVRSRLFCEQSRTPKFSNQDIIRKKNEVIPIKNRLWWKIALPILIPIKEHVRYKDLQDTSSALLAAVNETSAIVENDGGFVLENKIYI